MRSEDEEAGRRKPRHPFGGAREPLRKQNGQGHQAQHTQRNEHGIVLVPVAYQPPGKHQRAEKESYGMAAHGGRQIRQGITGNKHPQQEKAEAVGNRIVMVRQIQRK